MTELASGRSAPPGPADALRARLDDPEVAAALSQLLDKADVLALLVEAIDGFTRRGDVITESLAGGIAELRVLGDTAANLREPVQLVASEAPRLMTAFEQVMDSGMLRPEVLTLLGTFADALVEGAATARAQQTTVSGVRSALRALKDPDVARGLGFLVEVSRALGRAV